jgi:hypothetical protein
VRTDHSSLQWLLNISGDNSRLVRWRLRLSEFSFEIQYKPGRTNQVADVLSRIYTGGTDKEEFDLEVPCLSVEVAPVLNTSIAVPKSGPIVAEVSLEPLRVSELRSAQDDDEICRALLEKKLTSEDDRGLLCRVSPLDGSVQIVVPTSYK